MMVDNIALSAPALPTSTSGDRAVFCDVTYSAIR